MLRQSYGRFNILQQLWIYVITLLKEIVIQLSQGVACSVLSALLKLQRRRHAVRGPHTTARSAAAACSGLREQHPVVQERQELLLLPACTRKCKNRAWDMRIGRRAVGGMLAPSSSRNTTDAWPV